MTDDPQPTGAATTLSNFSNFSNVSSLDNRDGLDNAGDLTKLDVLAIGHALVDVLSPATEEFLEEHGIARGAMQLVDDDRARLLYEHMGPAGETSGGSAANTAAGIVACGGSAAFIGTVADDELGQIFAHDLRAAGVRYETPPMTPANTTGTTDDLQPSSGRSQTGRSLILVSSDGERSMNTNIGVASRVSMEHLDISLLEAARITYVEGYLFDDSHPIDGWSDAVKAVRAAGNRFSITLSDPFCVERHRALFAGLLDGSVDICFGNGDEVCALFEVGDLELALDQMAERCELAAITLGGEGSVLVSGSRRIEIPPEPADVVDTTGAGDLYAAGVLAGLVRGWDLELCGQLGSLAASAVISRLGARLPGPIRHPGIS